MKGIKKRVFLNYFIGAFLLLFCAELIFMVAIRQYYYNAVEQRLKEKVESTSLFYNNYLNKTYANFSDCVAPILENKTELKGLEVQFIDIKGNILLSNEVVANEKIQTDDFLKATEGKFSTWVGNNSTTREKVMSTATALKDYNSDVSVILRVVTSLDEVDNLILRYFLFSFTILFFILVLICTASTILSKTIIRPIKEVNDVARKMAKGEFREKIQKHYNDEIGELSDTLNYMASEILKADELKNNFISSVSHELRTPLTSIKGWSETILTGSFDDREEIEKGLKVILKETDRLKNMVEELLDFSKLENNKLSLYFENTNIKIELEEIVGLYDPRAKKERIYLQLKFSENIPEISIDRDRFRQVIINILDNAIKFSSKDSGILLNVFTIENKLIIEIKDQGCGISKEDLPRIKEKFFKGSSKKSGSGIGLAVCDELIKLHGGCLELESEINKGTNVKITLNIV